MKVSSHSVPLPVPDYVSILPDVTEEAADRAHLDIVGDIVRDARVVGVGEGAHFVREFAMVRVNLARFLVEHCGFTHVALEVGRKQAALLETWMQGDCGAFDLPTCAGPLTRGVYGGFLKWLAAFNRSRSSPVRIVGPDLSNTLTLSSDLDVFDAYLSVVDPPSLPVLAEARSIAARVEGGSAVVSAMSWAALTQNEHDRLSARLAQLAIRFASLEPLFVEHGGLAQYREARHHLDAARHTDQMLRAMNELFSGTGLPGETSIRDSFAASSLSDILVHEPESTRIILLAHNNHVQKVPVSFYGELTAVPMGRYLSRELGNRYCSLALTHLGQSVPEMNFPKPESSVGFDVSPVELPAPETGSIEHALLEVGLDKSPVLVNLRKAASSIEFTQIRSQSANVRAPLQEAFDAVIAVPKATVEPDLPF